MDDLISRREAIDAVSKGCQELRGVFGRCEENLLDLPSAQRWIPCSERLPEKVGRYLVTCEKWGAWAVDWNIWVGEPKSWLWEQGVTAWMPLPEPYREDGDNDA